MMHAEPSLIRQGLHDGVWHITLARPQQRNAMTPEMLKDLLAAIQGMPQEARVLLLDGEGKVFCAGFDLERSQGQEGIAVVRALLTGLSTVVETMIRLRVPVVVAVQGAAIAGGCALLGGADAVISHCEAQFGYPAARLGLSPAVSAPTLSMHTGFGAARALQLDGELIDGERAKSIGLVTHLTARETVTEHALSVAQQFVHKPVAAIPSTRDLLQSLAPQLDPAAGLLKSGLDASLAGTGTEEQLALLAKAWASTRPKAVHGQSSPSS